MTKRLTLTERLELVVAYTLLVAATLVILVMCSTASRAEGLIPTPWGWRAAPCCRENGIQGIRGIPPLEFIIGTLAPVMAPYLPPPFGYAVPPPPPPPLPYYGPAYGRPALPPPPYGRPGLPPPRYNGPTYRPRYSGPPPQAMPEEAYPEEQEAVPPAMAAPPPPNVAPGQPDDGFIAFCNANPAAPPCRNRVRGQR